MSNKNNKMVLGPLIDVLSVNLKKYSNVSNEEFDKRILSLSEEATLFINTSFVHNDVFLKLYDLIKIFVCDKIRDFYSNWRPINSSSQWHFSHFVDIISILFSNLANQEIRDFFKDASNRTIEKNYERSISTAIFGKQLFYKLEKKETSNYEKISNNTHIIASGFTKYPVLMNRSEVFVISYLLKGIKYQIPFTQCTIKPVMDRNIKYDVIHYQTTFMKNNTKIFINFYFNVKNILQPLLPSSCIVELEGNGFLKVKDLNVLSYAEYNEILGSMTYGEIHT